ncbi:hypothetical protein [Pseudomonas sp. YuFO8]|uniref:hypothetical protein n=1 Tax=Pseudomonas sp. YuFO8 TaxID=3095361 RepID=UPI002B2534EF|nr:hypothetical protein [Pseudomonas sp. YuFO8]MEB2623786.1 hypothetical protein [Pseudomonas sp. YuFO8]
MNKSNRLDYLRPEHLDLGLVVFDDFKTPVMRLQLIYFVDTRTGLVLVSALIDSLPTRAALFLLTNQLHKTPTTTPQSSVDCPYNIETSVFNCRKGASIRLSRPLNQRDLFTPGNDLLFDYILDLPPRYVILLMNNALVLKEAWGYISFQIDKFNKTLSRRPNAD